METEWLESHNIHRKCCGVPQLQWDDTLAQRAQDWADWLKNNFDGMPRHPDASAAEKDQYLSYDGKDYTTSPLGQNIAWNWGRNIDNGGSPSNSVDAWYLEGEFYDSADPSLYCDGCDPESGDELGHFTQLCWKGSTKVGCGVARTINNDVLDDNGVLGDENSAVWVCNYSPAGNVLVAGSDLYTRFKTNVGTWEPDCNLDLQLIPDSSTTGKFLVHEIAPAPQTMAPPITEAPQTMAPHITEAPQTMAPPITEAPDIDDVRLPPPPVVLPDVEKKVQQAQLMKQAQRKRKDQKERQKQKTRQLFWIAIAIIIIGFIFSIIV